MHILHLHHYQYSTISWTHFNREDIRAKAPFTMKELKQRFFTTVSPLKYFLLMIGIDWNPEKSNARIEAILKGWCFFCLFIDVIFSILYYMRRSQPEILNLFVYGNKEPAMDSLTKGIDRLNKLVCNVSVHVILFCSIRKIANDFLNQLENVDFILNRPNLCAIRRSSVAGIVWMLFLVSIESRKT